MFVCSGEPAKETAPGPELENSVSTTTLARQDRQAEDSEQNKEALYFIRCSSSSSSSSGGGGGGGNLMSYSGRYGQMTGTIHKYFRKLE